MYCGYPSLKNDNIDTHQFFPFFLVDVSTCYDVTTREWQHIALFLCLKQRLGGGNSVHVILVPITKLCPYGVCP